MAIFYFVLLIVLCWVPVALRRRPHSARVAYWFLLVFSLLPYLLHVAYTWGYITRSSFDGPEGGTAVFPGLVALAFSGVVFAAGLLALGAALLRRLPLLAALTPTIMSGLYWSVSLRFLYWRSPAHLMIDNVPLIWLFISSLFSTVLLLLCGWFAFERSAVQQGEYGRRTGPQHRLA